jgi:DNA-binding IclR family transcriptional regulator
MHHVPYRATSCAAYSCAMSNDQPAEATGGGVQSVDRAVTVLEILARGSAGVSEVAAQLGVHKSTAFRLLTALEDRELVEQAQNRGKYRLGFGVLRLANAVLGRLDLTQQGRPVCEQLAAELGETVNIAVRRSHYVVNVDQARGPSAVVAHNWVGELTPLHATSSGKILLAFMKPEERREALGSDGLPRFTPHTITSFVDLNSHLDQAARAGYACAVEELEEGLNAIAAPVRDHTGVVIAALSVSGPAYRFDRDQLSKVTPAVVGAAATVSHRMGFLD